MRQQWQADAQPLELVPIRQNMRNLHVEFLRLPKSMQMRLNDFIMYSKLVWSLLAGLIKILPPPARICLKGWMTNMEFIFEALVDERKLAETLLSGLFNNQSPFKSRAYSSNCLCSFVYKFKLIAQYTLQNLFCHQHVLSNIALPTKLIEKRLIG